MSLSILVVQDLWQDFDQQWKACIDAEAPVDEVVVALGIAGDKKRISRCMPLVKEHAELLEAGDRPADAAVVLGAALVAGGNPGELNADLLRTAQAAWSNEVWWAPYTELVGLRSGAPDLRQPWKRLARARRFRPQTLVFHPGGWGVGEVLEVREVELALDVRFWNGRRDTFPMSAAVDIFEPLDESDLKAQHFRDAQGLRQRVKQKPLEVLRGIVASHHGRATTALIRTALMQVGIEGSAWTAWWRKARKLAENSEWFDVTGSAQKATVKLLLAAKDPAESLRRQLELASDLGEVLARVRELFIGEKVDERLRDVGLEGLERAAADASQPRAARVAAWLLLREQRGETPGELVQVVAEVRAAETPTDPSTAPELWNLFQSLGTVRDQERALEFMKAVSGEEWIEEAAQHLPHAAPGMVRQLVDDLDRAGRQLDLMRHYVGLLARPLRAPALLVTLARMFEPDKLPAAAPTALQRAHSLLSLANHLYEERRGNAHLTRVHQRLVDVLAGGPEPLLRTLLAGADAASLRGLQTVIARGIEPSIDHVVTDIAVETDRHFFAADLAPFWVGDTIWTTRSGLERRGLELKELREVKIPQNEDAIGRAAAFGDLSENSEWEAAMEEQRTLTSRAMEIEEQIRRADLIENAALPEDTACPGTQVRYRELPTGAEREVVILGPWDDHMGDGVVSYRAPLATGLLGHHPGDQVVLRLPSGELAVQLLEVIPAHLERPAAAES